MTRGHQVAAGRAVPLEPLPVGSYRLEIKVTDNPSGVPTTCLGLTATLTRGSG